METSLYSAANISLRHTLCWFQDVHLTQHNERLN